MAYQVVGQRGDGAGGRNAPGGRGPGAGPADLYCRNTRTCRGDHLAAAEFHGAGAAAVPGAVPGARTPIRWALVPHGSDYAPGKGRQDSGATPPEKAVKKKNGTAGRAASPATAEHGDGPGEERRPAPGSPGQSRHPKIRGPADPGQGIPPGGIGQPTHTSPVKAGDGGKLGAMLSSNHPGARSRRPGSAELTPNHGAGGPKIPPFILQGRAARETVTPVRQPARHMLQICI
jgi:hypothetical protein